MFFPTRESLVRIMSASITCAACSIVQQGVLQAKEPSSPVIEKPFLSTPASKPSASQKSLPSTDRQNTKNEGDDASRKKRLAGETLAPSVVKSRRVRVPRYYGKLQLTDEQRAQVLTVVSKYQHLLDELESRIAEIKSERESEFEASLNPRQLKQLQELKRPSSQRDSR